jgi:hypothetical protein
LDNKLTGILYRILKGRLRFSQNGLVLYIHEPSLDIIAESYDIYNEHLRAGYLQGLYINSEITNLLIAHDIWLPDDNKKIEDVKTQIEDIKVECYQNFYDKKKLAQLKYKLKNRESELYKLYSKKSSMDHLTCDGLAENARIMYIISKTVFYEDGAPFDWNGLDYSEILMYYQEHSPTSAQVREIARNDPWRSMWNISKKRGGPIEGPTTFYSRDQLALCSYSLMYDNVYENPDAPSDEIIENDDCLDGWFIHQRRKSEKDKKLKSTGDIITNPRIKNSKEIFIMAPTRETANDILDLNDPHSRSIIKQREESMKGKENVKDSDFADVQVELQLKKNNAFIKSMKGRK